MLTLTTVLWRRQCAKNRIIILSIETMTRPRQQRKPRFLATLGLSVLVAAMASATGSSIIIPKAARASPDDRLVINPTTGLAISGFDPVAYFTRKQPVSGSPELELTLNGAVWRFANEGNRAAFAENPEVYTPRFGGYDPVAIVRGASVPGHPLFWVVMGERLYLFYDDKARKEFLANPGVVLERAMRRWPDVARTIAR